MNSVSRRKLLLGLTTATATGIAGCSGGGSAGDSPAGDEGDGSSPGTTAGAGGAGTPNDSPDPNCARLTGSPAPYDVSGTPFVFGFDYVDSWTVDEPLEGPGGRVQGISSPTVTVDGSTESASVALSQKFDPLTASEVDETVADSVSGDYARAEVLDEQQFDGETIRFVGLPDITLPYYLTWLPYGDGDARYYPVTLEIRTTIFRLDDDNVAQELCVDASLESIETVRRSLRPNSDSTIDEV